MDALHPLLAEHTLTFAQAAASLPVIGGRPFRVQMIYRWADEGVLVGGERVYLEFIRLGSKRVTSIEALTRFIEATSTRGPKQSSPRPPRTPNARRKSSEAAAKYVLDEIAKS